MKIVLIVVFILTACGLFLLLSGILKLPTLRTGRARKRISSMNTVIVIAL